MYVLSAAGAAHTTRQVVRWFSLTVRGVIMTKKSSLALPYAPLAQDVHVDVQHNTRHMHMCAQKLDG